MNEDTDTYRVLSHLKIYKSITMRYAKEKLNNHYLTISLANIKKMGYEIQSQKVRVRGEGGVMYRTTEYKLIEKGGEQLSLLDAI